MKHRTLQSLAAVALAWAGAGAQTAVAQTTVYRCPGNVYTDGNSINVKEAADRGCKVIKDVPITIMQSPRPRPAASASSGVVRSGGEGSRVDPAEQRARDSDARRVLEDELRREEDRLAELKKEYNNGEPERQGNERNYAKYQERVADLKASIARKEDDIASIKREIGKLPPP